MPMTAPRRASSCWRAARSAACRSIFRLARFRVMDDRRWNARGELVTESEATITVEVGERAADDGRHRQRPGERARHGAAQGAAAALSASSQDMRLVDYKVRILTPKAGTDAVTRVMIESADETGERWTHRRRLDQHHRRLLQRAARRHHLEAVPRRRRRSPPAADRADGRHRSQAGGAPPGRAGDHPGRAAARREYRHGGARHAQLRPDRSAPGAAARRLAQARRRASAASGADAVIDGRGSIDSTAEARSPISAASTPPRRATAT